MRAIFLAFMFGIIPAVVAAEPPNVQLRAISLDPDSAVFVGWAPRNAVELRLYYTRVYHTEFTGIVPHTEAVESWTVHCTGVAFDPKHIQTLGGIRNEDIAPIQKYHQILVYLTTHPLWDLAGDRWYTL